MRGLVDDEFDDSRSNGALTGEPLPVLKIHVRLFFVPRLKIFRANNDATPARAAVSLCATEGHAHRFARLQNGRAVRNFALFTFKSNCCHLIFVLRLDHRWNTAAPVIALRFLRRKCTTAKKAKTMPPI